jgi:hypothetical protein
MNRPLRSLALATLAAAALSLAPARARAEDAAPDSALGRFLGGLADSTDSYFGLTAAPLDTAGLDSARIAVLAAPPRARLTLPLSLWPELRFDRVDGNGWGGGLAFGRLGAPLRLEGRLRYAAGSDAWLGGGALRATRRVAGAPLRFALEAGRATVDLDRDSGGRRLGTLRALVSGRDARQLMRRDGVRVSLERRSPLWRAGLAYRDELERPLPVTTTWNLFDRELSVPGNLPAARGRAHETEFSAAARLPRTPLELELRHATSGRAIGSDFEYRRTRASLGGDIGLGRHVAALPQLVYGRLSGEAVPQAAFYLGEHSLRSRGPAPLGGSGLALARLDLVGTFDVLTAARVPHPAMLPLQLGVSAATGAVWGADPAGGPVRPGVDWPRAEAWRSEVGVSLHYQPGIPDPTDLMRFDVAWPVGSHASGPRLSVSYTRALDLARTRER